MNLTTRRRFLGDAGLSAALLPFVTGLSSLQARSTPVKQRIVFIFTPNGIVPPDFWPEETGAKFTLKRILEPLAPFQEKTLILQGLSNRVRGDGDGHMRGMSCLLTGIELFPGNIQGGSDTPAGWASGPSIDQEVAQFLQSNPQTRTRFGSIELGVAVPNKADPWTRWTYAGPNQPIAPISDPYAVFERLYGQVKDRENLSSILDSLRQDLRRLSGITSLCQRPLHFRLSSWLMLFPMICVALPRCNIQAPWAKHGCAGWGSTRGIIPFHTIPISTPVRKKSW